MRRFYLQLALASALAVGITGLAQAQDANPAGPSSDGPVIPGICLLSRQAIFAHAKIGVAATARLQQLADREQARLDGLGKSLDADIKAFQARAAAFAPAERQSRQQALNQRLTTFTADRQQSSRALEATRVYAMNQIAAQAGPIVNSEYAAQKCGLLLDRNVVLRGNIHNDLTAAVVKNLDTKVRTISFGLQPPPAPTAASPAATLP